MNGNRTPMLINGVMYSWSQLVLTINGMPITGVTKIDYDDKQTIEPIYGIGQSPVGVGYGNIETSASITLFRGEVEAMREAVVTGRLQDIAPFDIVVSYIPLTGGKVVNHKLRNCIIKNDPFSMGQGNTKDEVSLELFCAKIER